jgi:hypothetical protein
MEMQATVKAVVIGKPEQAIRVHGEGKTLEKLIRESRVPRRIEVVDPYVKNPGADEDSGQAASPSSWDPQVPRA